MANITIRNIPDDILTKLRTLSKLEKRSLNNEILLILEKGLFLEMTDLSKGKFISKDSQINIWQKISGNWEDKRSTKEIISDIISNRSKGREIEL